MIDPKYQEFTLCSVKKATSSRDHLDLAALGIAGEAGEVVDECKKALWHHLNDVVMDRRKLRIELGDLLWYVTILLHTTGLTVQEVLDVNVAKLCERYPKENGRVEDWIGEDRGTRAKVLLHNPDQIRLT